MSLEFRKEFKLKKIPIQNTPPLTELPRSLILSCFLKNWRLNFRLKQQTKLRKARSSKLEELKVRRYQNFSAQTKNEK